MLDHEDYELRQVPGTVGVRGTDTGIEVTPEQDPTFSHSLLENCPGHRIGEYGGKPSLGEENQMRGYMLFQRLTGFPSIKEYCNFAHKSGARVEYGRI
jgi:hypothetical protein